MTDAVVVGAVGLTTAEATARRAQEGANDVPPPPTPSLARRVVREVRNPLSALLLAAAFVSVFVLGERGEGAAIVAIVTLNIAVSVVQERRADVAVAALRQLSAPRARVRRDGVSVDIDVRDIVRGDVLEAAAGDRVAADGELLEAVGLAVDEQVLTGESMPVEKAPGDEMLAGTLIVRGRGTVEVTATGARSTLGRLAQSLGAKPTTPLAIELRHTAARMTALAVLLSAVLVPVAWVRGSGDGALAEALLFGVALAVAAIPEGLLAVVTLALSIGAQRMATRGAIVRHLPAIEALGATSVLCTDKTGTLTTGRLRVAEIVTVHGLDENMWAAALRCNDAEGGTGDPIEVAIREEAARLGLALPLGVRVGERPFDAATRSMATLHDSGGRLVVSVKGAPEAVLARCKPADDVSRLAAAADRLAGQGRRVLAVADGSCDLDADGLRLLGLFAFEDPLRDSTRGAVDALAGAGIRLVVVTGDHPATAAAVAHEAGLATDVVTGEELAGMSSQARDIALASASVLARVDPSVKVDLVAAHRARGHVVAMTGDGVNDAPALRNADVGVAVSVAAGTDVAREAADIVLTDSNLGTVVEAVREGRRIYRNLVSVVGYLVSGNLSEIGVIVVGLALFPDVAAPLLPVQLLWVNLVTDGLPALALAVDSPPDDLLRQPPRPSTERILHWRRQLALAGRGAVAAAAVVTTALVAGATETDDVRVRLVAALPIVHLALAYVARGDRRTFGPGWWRSRPLLVAVALSVVVHVAAFTFEPVRDVLGLGPLPLSGWLLAAAAALLTVVVIDLARMVSRHLRGEPTFTD